MKTCYAFVNAHWCDLPVTKEKQKLSSTLEVIKEDTAKLHQLEIDAFKSEHPSASVNGTAFANFTKTEGWKGTFYAPEIAVYIASIGGSIGVAKKVKDLIESGDDANTGSEILEFLAEDEEAMGEDGLDELADALAERRMLKGESEVGTASVPRRLGVSCGGEIGSACPLALGLITGTCCLKTCYMMMTAQACEQMISPKKCSSDLECESEIVSIRCIDGICQQKKAENFVSEEMPKAIESQSRPTGDAGAGAGIPESVVWRHHTLPGLFFV